MSKKYQKAALLTSLLSVVAALYPPNSLSEFSLLNQVNGDYAIVYTVTGVCSHINYFPSGHVGLMQLRSKYPSPHYIVNYGYCS